MTKYQLYEMVIKKWLDDNPEEWLAFKKDLELIKQTRLNSFASSESKNIRWGMSIPTSLYKRLKAADPTFLDTKANTHSFMKFFKAFTIPIKV